jgi:hypothetical protein
MSTSIESDVGDSTTTTTVSVEEVVVDNDSSTSAAVYRFLPFAIRLPVSIFQGFHEPTIMKNPTLLTTMLQDTGIVGHVTIMKKSILIWFGWGQVEEVSSQTEAATTTNHDNNNNNSSLPAMGPFMVAMPRTNYTGAFATNEAATTKLIGGDNEDEELLCRQMASRLSTKLGIAVFCSSALNASIHHSLQGMVVGGEDLSLIQHRVAALTEKKVYELLQDLNL